MNSKYLSLFKIKIKANRHQSLIRQGLGLLSREKGPLFLGFLSFLDPLYSEEAKWSIKAQVSL